MRDITPTLAVRATQANDTGRKLGVQVGRPIGHSRPPRVYVAINEVPNAGVAGVVTKVFETGGPTDAWEIPEYKSSSFEEQVILKTGECVQSFLDMMIPPEDGVVLFLAGDGEMASRVVDELTIPEGFTVKINDGDPDYVPEPSF